MAIKSIEVLNEVIFCISLYAVLFDAYLLFNAIKFTI